MSPSRVPQRPIVTFIAATVSAVTFGGIGVVAHASSSASARPSGLSAADAFRPLAASRPAATQRRTAVAAPATRHRLVDAAVANVWGGPHKPRHVDAPSLLQPPQLDRWLGQMSVRQRRGLTPRLSTQVRFGDEVVVLRRRGIWSKIRIPNQVGGRFPNGIKGWVVSRQLGARPADWTQHPSVATVTGLKAQLTWVSGLAMHTLAVSYATTLPVVAASAGTVTVELPGRTQIGTLPRSTVAVHPTGTPAIRPSAAAVVAEAKRFLGLPYLWAGMSAWGYDCSGLTSTVLSQLGVVLPRDAADQSTFGKRVARRHLHRGDLVFFSHGNRWAIHHVAIYLGHGKVIQSPFSGARVDIKSLWHSYLGKEFWGATRPLASPSPGQ